MLAASSLGNVAPQTHMDRTAPSTAANLEAGPARAVGRRWLAAVTLAGWMAQTCVAAAPRPPAFPALDIGVEGLDAGEVLLGELNCTACHVAEPAVLARLKRKTAPLLGRAAARLNPSYVRAWLLDPLGTKPGTTMPDVLHRLPEDERVTAAGELAQFLWSLPSEAAAPASALAGEFQIQQGRALYHQAGCVACHAPYEPAGAIFAQTGGGPTDPDAVRYVLNKLQETAVPLPDLAAKYQPGALARFLADPLAVRPAGRMPSLKLTEAEARAIAAYLPKVTGTAPGDAAEPPFVADPAKARRGRERFAQLGCAACHELGGDLPPIPSQLKARPLAALKADASAGCLASEPGPAAPRYFLGGSQRDALRATLKNVAALAQPTSPAARVLLTMARHDCYACHSRDGLGGPSPSRSDYFTSSSESDLGDEGRIPPHLSGVGNKLRPDWLGQVLTNQGAVRPYLAVRMPQFGAANVAHLVADFGAADALPNFAKVAPPGDAAAGRELVGLQGCGCINCHTFGPHPSLGISVMDMTQIAKQLNWDWFRRYVVDPGSLRPGTRMPSFWPEGKATVTAILDGDTARQVAAIWAYLSQGIAAEPPPGLLENLQQAKPSQKTDYE